MPPNTYLVHPILSQYTARDRAGNTNITATDVKAMVAADTAEIEPQADDLFALENGEIFSVVAVTPFMPGGVILYWTLQLRAGG